MKQIILGILLLMYMLPSSAQKKTVELTILNNFHTMNQEVLDYFNQYLPDSAKIKKEPLVLFESFNLADFHETYINKRGDTFRIESYLTQLKNSKDVGIAINVSDMTREYNEHILGSVRTAAERWVIKIKKTKGRGTFRTGIWCSPPRAPRGKELFLYAKARLDLRDESKCRITYQIKEKRTKKPFLMSEWPSEEEFQKRAWVIYEDKDGSRHEIDINGMDHQVSKEEYKTEQ